MYASQCIQCRFKHICIWSAFLVWDVYPVSVHKFFFLFGFRFCDCVLVCVCVFGLDCSYFEYICCSAWFLGSGGKCGLFFEM